MNMEARRAALLLDRAAAETNELEWIPPLAFLKERIGFLDIAATIERTMHAIAFVGKPTYADYVATDREARRFAAGLI